MPKLIHRLDWIGHSLAAASTNAPLVIRHAFGTKRQTIGATEKLGFQEGFLASPVAIEAGFMKLSIQGRDEKVDNGTIA